MPNLQMTLEHNGTTYNAEIARIEDTTLGEEDRLWTALLHFQGLTNSWGQSNGARSLDRYVSDTDEREGTAFGMDHVMAICRTLGCRKWESVRGQRCLVLRRQSFGPIEGIADLSAERVLIFQEHANKWYSAEAVSA